MAQILGVVALVRFLQQNRWTRLGDTEPPEAMAVIMSDGLGGSKWMEVGKRNATFYDLTEHVKQSVRTNADGWGEFRCNGGSV